MLAQQPTPVPTEGVPWWVTAGLSALGIVAGVVTTYLSKKAPPEPPKPPPDPSPGLAVPSGVMPSAMPTTADGQLELAKQLVAEVVRDRNETKAELIEAQAMVDRLKARVQDQDLTIARLQQLLGTMPTPPQSYPGQWPNAPRS